MALKMPGPVALVDQVIAAIRDDVDNHALLPGARLLSIRDFARKRRVSRYTAVSAYDRLVATGHIESRPRSGFYVTSRRNASAGVAAGAAFHRVYDVAWLIRQALEDGRDMVKVGGPWLPDHWLDGKGIQREMRGLGR